MRICDRCGSCPFLIVAQKKNYQPDGQLRLSIIFHAHKGRGKTAETKQFVNEHVQPYNLNTMLILVSAALTASENNVPSRRILECFAAHDNKWCTEMENIPTWFSNGGGTNSYTSAISKLNVARYTVQYTHHNAICQDGCQNNKPHRVCHKKTGRGRQLTRRIHPQFAQHIYKCEEPVLIKRCRSQSPEPVQRKRVRDQEPDVTCEESQQNQQGCQPDQSPQPDQPDQPAHQPECSIPLANVNLAASSTVALVNTDETEGLEEHEEHEEPVQFSERERAITPLLPAEDIDIEAEDCIPKEHLEEHVAIEKTPEPAVSTLQHLTQLAASGLIWAKKEVTCLQKCMTFLTKRTVNNENYIKQHTRRIVEHEKCMIEAEKRISKQEKRITELEKNLVQTNNSLRHLEVHVQSDPQSHRPFVSGTVIRDLLRQRYGLPEDTNYDKLEDPRGRQVLTILHKKDYLIGTPRLIRVGSNKRAVPHEFQREFMARLSAIIPCCIYEGHTYAAV